MADVSFTVDTSIYDDRNYLRDSYDPDRIVGRDEELTEYRNALLPVINGEDPDHIFLYGKTGVGKTVCTDYILTELEKQSNEHDVGVEVVKINCDGLNSSYQVAIQIVNELRPMDEQMSESGHTTWKVYEAMYEELDAIGGTILLVLDELDSIDNDKLDGILYQLPRARSNGYLDEARVGIIGITNDLTLRESLAPDVQSTLREKTIKFKAYDATELQKVLRQRADKAFYDDALEDGVIQKCAAIGAQDGGDARRAIQLLREAGDLARQENAESVTVEHVEQAREKLREDLILSSIKNLQDNEKIALYALASLTCEKDEPPRSRTVYERYKELADKSPNEPVTYRRVRSYLRDLDGMRITNRNPNEGGSDGNYQTHELNSDVADVLNNLEDIIEICGVHSSVANVDADVINRLLGEKS